MILVALDAIAGTYRMLRARVAKHLALTTAPAITDLMDLADDFPEAHREDAERLLALELNSSGGGSVIRQAEPHPHAIDTLAKLARQKLIAAVYTSRPGSAFTASQAWLKQRGLGTLPLEYCASDSGTRSADTKALQRFMRPRRIRVLIDHDPLTAHAIAEDGFGVILLDQPHNALLQHPRVLRAYGWSGIGALIDAFPLDVRKDRRGF